MSRPAQIRRGARFEKAEEQAGEEIGQRDAIEDAEQAHVRPGPGESAGIKDADDGAKCRDE